MHCAHSIAVYTAYLNHSERALKTFAAEKIKNVSYLLYMLSINFLSLNVFYIVLGFLHVTYSRARTHSHMNELSL